MDILHYSKSKDEIIIPYQEIISLKDLDEELNNELIKRINDRTSNS